eukprot:scpid68381/ scgid12073/ 
MTGMHGVGAVRMPLITWRSMEYSANKPTQNAKESVARLQGMRGRLSCAIALSCHSTVLTAELQLLVLLVYCLCCLVGGAREALLCSFTSLFLHPQEVFKLCKSHAH